MKTCFTILCSALIATPALAEQEVGVPASQDASAATSAVKHSRIRMYGQNGALALIFPGLSCTKSAWGKEGIHVSGGMGQAFSSFIGAVDNLSLGMPETEVSKNVSRKDGILSKAYYQEHEIPAGQITSLALGFQDVSAFHRSTAHGITTTYSSSSPGCSSDISFIPEAGADYEVGFTMQGRRCYVEIFKLTKTDTETDMTPVPIQKAKPCPTATQSPVMEIGNPYKK
ncbi:hypothetical protein [Chitinibacter sp. S2-10]|uniref:hypothetical protein n=1 Tax=Chitinibacter sp. S2-10 TaxID=3373597 RepID=UPI003977DEC4